jgi:putative ABC transport system substrate-binding protein
LVGVLLAGDRSYPSFASFLAGLRELGHVEGRTFTMAARFADGQLDRLPALAAELVTLGVDVIAVVGAVTFWAARRETSHIPIVFSVVIDPVAAGMVAHGPRPEGNVTGVTSFDPGQARSQIRILKETLPGLSRLAILGDAGVPDILPNLYKAAAEADHLSPHVILLTGADDLQGAFAAFRDRGADALLSLEVPRTSTYGRRISDMATEALMPTMFGRDLARYEPMLAYGTSLSAAARRMAGMVDQILKGVDVASLPVQSVTQHELVINLTIARALGVVIPPTVLSQASKVVR